jgi:hypothetical protein
MARLSTEVTTLINYFKQVGFTFANTMKQLIEDGDVKPPKGLTKEEYIKMIDTAHEEGLIRAAERKNTKNKKIDEVTAKKPTK